MTTEDTHIATDRPTLAHPLAPADCLDTSTFDAKHRQQLQSIAASVAASDSPAIATFGAGPQRKLSGFFDQILASSRVGEIGIAAQLATELATALAALDLPAVAREAQTGPSLLARLPVLGKRVSATRRLRAGQSRIATELQDIEHRIHGFAAKFKASNAVLDRVLGAIGGTVREIDVWIAGGQQALLRLQSAFDADRTTLAAEPDPVLLAKLHQTAGQIDAFAARLARIQAASTRTAQAMPQIGAAQHAGRIEVQTALDAILAGLPGLRDALAGDVPALTHAAATLSAPIEQVLRLDRDNRLPREDAVQQLGALRTELLEGLQAQTTPPMWG